MEDQKVFVRNTKLSEEKNKQLYLDSKRADVTFLFAGSIKVPAHSIILSSASPVFDDLFYGPSPVKQPIKMHNASPKAFREFLKFFYFHEFKLKSKNIIQVAHFCKKYQVHEGLKLCETLMLQQKLTTRSMCSSYAAARSLNMEKLVKMCEKEITQKANKILQSADFLQCEHAVFDKILQLVSSNGSASAIVDACMAWARADCERNKLRPIAKNLKAKLKYSFDRIPFDKLNKDQFSQQIKKYPGLLDDDDWETIVLKIMSKRPRTTTSAVATSRAKPTAATTCGVKAKIVTTSSAKAKIVSNSGLNPNAVIIKRAKATGVSPSSIKTTVVPTSSAKTAVIPRINAQVTAVHTNSASAAAIPTNYDQATAVLMSPIEQLLDDILKNGNSLPFQRAMSKKKVPTYYEINTNPMDLTTITSKLSKGQYKSTAEVMKDVQLIFSNCHQYCQKERNNQISSGISECGTNLESYIEKRCKQLSLPFKRNMTIETIELD